MPGARLTVRESEVAAVEEDEGVEGERERELGMGKLSLLHCERAVSRTLHQPQWRTMGGIWPRGG